MLLLALDFLASIATRRFKAPFLGALHALRIYDCGCRTCFPPHSFPTFHEERGMHAIKRPIPVPQIEIAIHFRSRRLVFRYRAPLEVHRQNIQESVYVAMAVAASGCHQVHVRHKPLQLSENDLSYIAGELADYIEARSMSLPGAFPCNPRPKARSSAGARPWRTVSSWKTTICMATWRPRSPSSLSTTPSALSREPRQHNHSCRLLQQGGRNPQTARKDQTPDYPTSTLGSPQDRHLISTPR